MEESLQRLGTDRVDLYQFHDPDPRTPIEESWREMQHLIDEGKVRYRGLSNHSTKLIARTLKVGTVVSSQNQYNPLQRRAESELFPFCLEREIGVLGWVSLSEGVLADNFDINKLDPGDFRRRQMYAQQENRDPEDPAGFSTDRQQSWWDNGSRRHCLGTNASCTHWSDNRSEKRK